MNAMIPNKVRFDLDLQDLPARANQLSLEKLSLSAGRSCQDWLLIANGGRGARTLTYEYPMYLAERDCKNSCGVTYDRTYVYGNIYYACRCCVG